MTSLFAGFLILIATGFADDRKPSTVEVRLNDRHEFEVSSLVAELSKALGIKVEPPSSKFPLATTGLAGSLSKTLLSDLLGPGVTIRADDSRLYVGIAAERLGPELGKDWEKRLGALILRVEREASRRRDYGLWARESYRPNDPTRPTVCLIHGMNSTSSVFLHMVGPIEAAGYGVVVYDFPYNRDLDESVAAFRTDWANFRSKTGDKRPWAILAHSMGSLVGRGYVEGPTYRQDVADMILIAPVNGGSYLSKAQTALQFLQGMRAVSGKTRSDPLAHLGDGLGAAADDLTPGSDFLRDLNAKSRREGVAYHILAGDAGLISPAVRAQLEARMGILAKLSGPGLLGQLEEITEGFGDGCVAVARSKLVGVDDHTVLHVNHLELIRAPMLFPEPGPVVSMPHVLRWLAKDLPVARPISKKAG